MGSQRKNNQGQSQAAFQNGKTYTLKRLRMTLEKARKLARLKRMGKEVI